MMDGRTIEQFIIDFSRDLTRVRELFAHLQNFWNHERALESQRDSVGFLPGGIEDALSRNREQQKAAMTEVESILHKYGKDKTE
jgi:hypothetical protein